MGNEQSKEPCPEQVSEERLDFELTGPWISDQSSELEEPPICKVEPNLDLNKIATRKRKRVDDDVIYISDDDDVIQVTDRVILASIETVKPEVEPEVGPEVGPEVIDLIDDNTEKDDSNTDSDASPIKHHRTDASHFTVESMEVDEVKKSLFPVDPKYECSVSIYNCNADDIQELQVSQTHFSDVFLSYQL